MNETRPDVDRTLASLKDFQRATVEHAFRRLFTDADATKRFLVADEVGLGKTMVAKGVIAKAVDHLWDDPERRIDVVYICSNSQIARQNLSRLNVVGGREHRHADRLTMLPHVIRDLRSSRVNFVSFTPGTSFQVGSTGGKAEERALLYQMLATTRGREITSRSAWAKFFQGWMSRENFERQIAAIDRTDLDAELCRSFEVEVGRAWGPEGSRLADELEACVQEFTWRRRIADGELARRRDRLVGALRQLVARAAVEHLEPDLVILDEFQRFKDLLDTDHEGADLANAVFDHPDAKVLLLSATPYKMYTLPDEPEGDDHYRDFTRTIQFLGGDERAAVVERELRTMRANMIDGGDPALARAARDRVQHELRQVMCRTERLASTPDRDGMLVEKVLDGTHLTAGDLRAWRAFDDVARQIDRHDVFEYWRSTPYPLNLMERGSYQVRTKFQAAVERGDSDVAAALASGAGLLDWDDVRHYRALDPGNAKMRGLVTDVLDRGAWRLAWVPPSLPYYAPAGAYAQPELRAFTKRLLFSAWSVVPKAVAVVMSYGAERRAMEVPLAAMEEAGRTPTRYDDRPTTPPLQFRMVAGDDPRPGAMSTLGLLYPSPVLARLGDPLDVARELGTLKANQNTVLDVVRGRIETALVELPAGRDEARADDRWYWAAPMLLDRARSHDEESFWELALSRAAEDERHEGGAGFAAHLRLAQEVTSLELGRRPDDLTDVLSRLAVAGPGACALRALSRVTGGERSLTHPVIRREAFNVALGLRSLFNKPEIVALLRSEDDDRYWRAVLDHCLHGVLQSVLDEYAHVLVESEGQQGAHRLERAETIAAVMAEALSIRAATNVVEDVRVRDGRVELDEHRMSSHFAARYGRAVTSEQTAVRESTVRVAYNSPFRPFVLASTSVGQEGLDFHTYSHALVHWNLPGNPVDLEQREGRVHRYKGHAVRKNVAAVHGETVLNDVAADPWAGVFSTAQKACAGGGSDITPFWVYAPPGGAAIERYVPALPLSREAQHYRRLQRTVGAYRLVIGQPRQDDLLRYVGESGVDLDWLRVDLTPEPVEASADERGPDDASRQVFDPATDEPPVAPDPWGSRDAVLWSRVLYDGGLLAINVREGRAVTYAEYQQIGRRAGYSDLRGAAGARIRRDDDGGRWLAFPGRRELEGSAYALGLDLPRDLAW
ncbi:helicase-like protein [Sediminihabitans luteus]|uniref:Helicase-like protein n=1 Tax=Sediminihabitans luteus TaxID=1138585 RepID=A0A2M9CPN3_9CELL|nr:helicase-related protein [Sediminihabitans luteus]PJJ73855.1 helicase-like protein [Sediminihabitans luteus]GII98235.1 helicase [Sediminihabitans luteus]